MPLRSTSLLALLALLALSALACNGNQWLPNGSVSPVTAAVPDVALVFAPTNVAVAPATRDGAAPVVASYQTPPVVGVDVVVLTDVGAFGRGGATSEAAVAVANPVVPGFVPVFIQSPVVGGAPAGVAIAPTTVVTAPDLGSVGTGGVLGSQVPPQSPIVAGGLLPSPAQPPTGPVVPSIAGGPATVGVAQSPLGAVGGTGAMP